MAWPCTNWQVVRFRFALREVRFLFVGGIGEELLLLLMLLGEADGMAGQLIEGLIAAMLCWRGRYIGLLALTKHLVGTYDILW